MIIQTNIKLLLIDRYVIELIVTYRAVVDHSELPIYYVKKYRSMGCSIIYHNIDTWGICAAIVLAVDFLPLYSFELTQVCFLPLLSHSQHPKETTSRRRDARKWPKWRSTMWST